MILVQVRDELARCLVEDGDYCGAEKMLRCILSLSKIIIATQVNPCHYMPEVRGHLG